MPVLFFSPSRMTGGAIQTGPQVSAQLGGGGCAAGVGTLNGKMWSETLSQWPVNVKRPSAGHGSTSRADDVKEQKGFRHLWRRLGLDTIMGFSGQVSLELRTGADSSLPGYLLHHELDCLPFNSHNYP